MKNADRNAWMEEKHSAYLYRVLAEWEGDTHRARLFHELAAAAERQAALWAEEHGGAEGAGMERFAPSRRTRLVGWLVRRFGPRPLVPVLASLKVRGLSVYTAPPEGASSERILAAEGRRHRWLRSGGGLRAAVFGVNDGLVSNLCLIVGVAGAEVGPEVVLLTGVAGLLAGAFSMAAGEYVSVRSQRELCDHQLAVERAELENYPEEEASELASIYQARGMEPEEAAAAAARLIADPERALDALAREELGIAPNQLGSPWGAAAASFVAFSAGAAVPLAPFALVAGDAALWVSIAASACAILAVGAALSLFTGRNAARSGLRMLAIGGAAAAVTHGIGRWLGVAIT